MYVCSAINAKLSSKEARTAAADAQELAEESALLDAAKEALAAVEKELADAKDPVKAQAALAKEQERIQKVRPCPQRALCAALTRSLAQLAATLAK